MKFFKRAYLLICLLLVITSSAFSDDDKKQITLTSDVLDKDGYIFENAILTVPTSLTLAKPLEITNSEIQGQLNAEDTASFSSIMHERKALKNGKYDYYVGESVCVPTDGDELMLYQSNGLPMIKAGKSFKGKALIIAKDVKLTSLIFMLPLLPNTKCMHFQSEESDSGYITFEQIFLSVDKPRSKIPDRLEIRPSIYPVPAKRSRRGNMRLQKKSKGTGQSLRQLKLAGVSEGVMENKAASIIQRAVTDFLDKKFLIKQHLKLGIPKNSIGSAKCILHAQSKLNLQAIKKQLGNLSDDEARIISKIKSTGIRFRHQTLANLESGKQLNMLSPLVREGEEECLFGQSTGLTGYLFYGVEFSEKFDHNVLRTKYDGRDFGPCAYLLDEGALNSRPCFITLANMCTTRVGLRNENETGVSRLYDSLFEYPSNEYPSNIFFIPDDFPLGIGLYLIKFLREKMEHEPEGVQTIERMVFFSDAKNNNIQKVLNSVFEPEAHAIRVLKTSDYKTTMIRDFTAYELIQRGEQGTLLDACSDKGAAIKILAELVDRDLTRLGRVSVAPLFKKIFSFVGRGDLPALTKEHEKISRLSVTKNGCDFVRHLCYEWNNDTRELLLKRGIVRLSDRAAFSDGKVVTMDEYISTKTYRTPGASR